jgi:hypothetical protein
MPHSAPIRPSIALAAFAERFIDGRRVVVFGNARSPLWEQLIERGARLVHVCDTDTARVSEAAARNTSQNVSFAPLGGSGLAVRDGAFDVGFIDDLTTFPDPAGVLRKLRRALSARGVALVAAPNPDVEDALIAADHDASRTLDYYTLYDLVHREFPVVRMAGQMPFVGYSVAELAPAEEPEPCLDAGFVPGGTEEPEWFVAVASQADVEFESFTVIQLPHNQLTRGGSERVLREQLRSARSAERSAVERLARLEAEQRKLNDVAQRHQKDVDLARQMRLLQEELERKESWILQLEARAATADARADEADQELEELRARVELVGADPAKPPTALEDWRKVTERLETEKCELVSKLTLAETHLKEAFERTLAERSGLELQREQAEARATSSAQQLTQERADLATQLAQANAQRSDFEQQLAQAAAQRSDFEQRLTQANAQRVDAERQLAVARERLDVVAQSSKADDAALTADLSALEAQLAERGARIRELERDLRRTEEFAARVVRELDRLRKPSPAPHQPQAELAVTDEVAPSRGEITADGFTSASPSLAAVAQSTSGLAATDSWSQGATSPTPASTDQSGEHCSAWADASNADLRERLDRLSALAARQQADLVAYGWRLEQLLAENTRLAKNSSDLDNLTAQLDETRRRLQETEVLLTQLAARSG